MLNSLSDVGELVERLPKEYACQVVEYLRGERREFEGSFEQEGTEFQQAVWRAMRRIPYGETRAYGELASMAGYPRAARAVGSACNRNKLPIVVPCHRVVASNGIGGYEFGIEAKKKLLELERMNCMDCNT